MLNRLGTGFKTKLWLWPESRNTDISFDILNIDSILFGNIMNIYIYVYIYLLTLYIYAIFILIFNIYINIIVSNMFKENSLSKMQGWYYIGSAGLCTAYVFKSSRHNPHECNQTAPNIYSMLPAGLNLKHNPHQLDHRFLLNTANLRYPAKKWQILCWWANIPINTTRLKDQFVSM